MKLSTQEVLVYRKGRHAQQTVRRHYLKWRSEQEPSIPLRCDNPQCFFHSNSPIWNGKHLKFVLDHKNGVCGDNRPKNLQLLCPNCNSQQSTHGGGNKGKTEQSAGGFAIKRQDGKKDYVMPVEPGKLKLTLGDVQFTHKKQK